MGRWQPPPLPSDFDGLPYPHLWGYPRFFFIKLTAKDVKEIAQMPGVSCFCVFMRQKKNRQGGVVTTPPPLVRRGLRHCIQNNYVGAKMIIKYTYLQI